MNATRATPNQISHLDYSFHKAQELGDNNGLKYQTVFVLVTGGKSAPL